MVRNLEFKARLSDPNAMLAKARSIGAELWGDLRQTDTYFNVPKGRLKLRDVAGFPAELIYYERAEISDRRESDYFVTAIPNPETALDLLSRTLGVRGVVRKRRTLVLLDTTRIHFDNVEGLGQFLEIEVPVKDDEQAADRRLDSLISGLGLTWQDCIRRSYVDLLEEKSA
jgi:predicted adenylyl cyclase CyaB